MTLITETDLRNRWKNCKDEEIKNQQFSLKPQDILTPSARSYLIEKGISLQKISEAVPFSDQLSEKNQVVYPKEIIGIQEFVTLDGGTFTKKPEYMTHLKGNTLVFKDHPIIAYRGKIDSLESEILLVQSEVYSLGMVKFTQDLEEVLTFVRNLIKAEVKEEGLEEFVLLGLTAKELRDQSHFPKKYFGIGHFMPEYKLPRPVLLVNQLRSKTRETELATYLAFKDEHGKVAGVGLDIMLALNRLSSLFYILMFRLRTNQYPVQ